jgi:hypothetical protein
MMVQPRYVGGVAVRPRYVGAPVEMVPNLGEQPVEYSPDAYKAGNLSFFGFGSTSIPAGSTGTTVTLNPVRPIHPQKLFTPSTVVGLLIVSASIGGTNLFAGSAGIPIEIFSEVSTSKPLDWITITPAVGVVFVIANPTAVALNFQGAIYGTSVRN